ncbi:uncharacterized protein LOC116215428 [Punica granatum]|uniref:Uncharacterized protein n=2 Tax=Punica granatum TaxID=22663 RepID=A0A218WSW4_PUNGR|nr:uncharacterized protein LOC116215428 [Punica granatum]OWM75062.1 hypothetical protein CDL15_Pgr021413 [Punica granatum]PKI45145.1 hypothetical protein CRG98_034449 [Punica granatum]
MAKVAFMFVFSLVLVMSIRTVIGADAPSESGGWSAMADKIGGVFSPNDDDNKGRSPTGAAMDQVRQAAAPTVHGMRGAAQAFASQASQAVDTAKQDTATWGDWLKHKLGAMNIFGGDSNKDEAPAMSPAA